MIGTTVNFHRFCFRAAASNGEPITMKVVDHEWATPKKMFPTNKSCPAAAIPAIDASAKRQALAQTAENIQNASQAAD